MTPAPAKHILGQRGNYLSVLPPVSIGASEHQQLNRDGSCVTRQFSEQFIELRSTALA